MPRRRHFEILERRRRHDGFFKLDLLRLRFERFAGGWSVPLSRELFVQREAVAALPWDPRSDRLVLIEQFRAGALEAPEGPWLIEAVAGLRESEEDPEAVARREVAEEAGLPVRRLERAGAYRSSPGATSELVHVYIAEVEAPTGGGIFGRADEHEDIRTLVVTRHEAFAWLDAGRITAATAVFPLLWLRARGGELRRRWLGGDDAAS